MKIKNHNRAKAETLASEVTPCALCIASLHPDLPHVSETLPVRLEVSGHTPVAGKLEELGLFLRTGPAREEGDLRRLMKGYEGWKEDEESCWGISS